MTKSEQDRFIKELIATVLKEMLAIHKAWKIPETWDGIELRWWIAERCGQVVISGTGSKSRKREYNNTVIVDNL